MDNADILARLAAAREFEVTTDQGRKFRLRLPSAFMERRLAMELADARPGGVSQQWLRAMLLAAVIGWEGVTADDLLHDGDQTALAFAPELVGPLLEGDLALFDWLGSKFHLENEAYKEKIGSAAKNSSSVSTGT